MMSVEEFGQKHRVIQRRAAIVLLPGLLIAAAMVGVLFMVAERLRPWAIEHWGAMVEVWMLIIWGLFSIVSIVLVVWLHMRVYRREPVLRCPRCRVNLAELQPGVVIASKHCPKCGRRVLEEVDGQTHGKPPGETGG